MGTSEIYAGNPFLIALADLVDGYDDETQRVPLVAIRAARDVLAGRLPAHWVGGS